MLAPELTYFGCIEGEMGKRRDVFVVAGGAADIDSVGAPSSALAIRPRDIPGVPYRRMCRQSAGVTGHDSLMNGLRVVIPQPDKLACKNGSGAGDAAPEMWMWSGGNLPAGRSRTSMILFCSMVEYKKMSGV